MEKGVVKHPHGGQSARGFFLDGDTDAFFLLAIYSVTSANSS